MHVRIYIPGAPLYDEDPATGKNVFCGRTTASIRDPFAKRKDIPVCLQEEMIGRAVSMKKLKIGDEPYLCFTAEIDLKNPNEVLAEKLDGYQANAAGCMWTSGIYIQKLHLQLRQEQENKEGGAA